MIEVVVIPLNVVSSDPVKFAEITDVPEEKIEQIETEIELDNSDIILEQTDIP